MEEQTFSINKPDFISKDYDEYLLWKNQQKEMEVNNETNEHNN